MLWYLGAMNDNVAAVVALGFRHRFLARVEGTEKGGEMMLDDDLVDSFMGKGWRREWGRLALVTMRMWGVTAVYFARTRV